MLLNTMLTMTLGCAFLLGSSVANAKDLLPIRYGLKVGDVQPQSEESLLWIDNSSVYLNPDKAGKHYSYFLYKAKDLPDVPHLEIRYKGTKGAFRVEIKKGAQWQKLATLDATQKDWSQNRFELHDGVTAFANRKGEVEVRILSIGKVESLEIDYLAITADQKNQKTAALEY